MSKPRRIFRYLAALLFAATFPWHAGAQWAGFVDKSTDLQTTRFAFTGTLPEGTGNDNYYDGDFGDFNGDGHIDRVLGSRYGLIINRGNAWFDYYIQRSGFIGRSMPSGSVATGEDQFQFVDADGDGDLDVISGGNNDNLTLQENQNGWFSVKTANIGTSQDPTSPNTNDSKLSALSITNTDADRDGDVDLFVSCAYGFNTISNGPSDFGFLINDGTGGFTDQHYSRGFSPLRLQFGKVLVVMACSADIDGDGDQDMVVSRGTYTTPSTSYYTELYFNNGSGQYTPVNSNLPCTFSGWELGMQLGDIDGDGDLDLVKAGGYTDFPQLWGNHPAVRHLIGINDGAGHFTDQSSTRFTGTYSGEPEQFVAPAILLLDVDYDNDLDIVTTSRIATPRFLTIFLNDGTGYFTHDVVHSRSIGDSASGFNVDLDSADLNGDGACDIWVGKGGDNHMHIFANTYQSPDGLDPDIPRNVQVVSADAAGVRIKFSHPNFAAVSRHYRVYRSLTPGVELRKRNLIKVIGLPFQDEKCFAPVDKLTNAMLGDATVNLDRPNRTVQFTDTTAVPGVKYYYSVVHIALENDFSKPSEEVAATIPGAGGVDTIAPQLSIRSPDSQDWSQHPKIIATFADENSGINPATLTVSWNKSLGDGTAAGTNIASRHDYLSGTHYIYNHRGTVSLPVNQVAALTVSIADMAGNVATSQVAYLPTQPLVNLPTANSALSATEGMAPLTVTFDGTASTEGANTNSGYPDKIMEWTWDYGDGSTSHGRVATKRYTKPGIYDAVLTARDNDGGASVLKKTITIGQTFSKYVQANFTAAQQSDPLVSGDDADYDKDGLTTLMEYYYQTNPKVADASGIDSCVEDGMLKLRQFRISQPADLTVSWLHSTDLEDWEPASPEFEEQLQDMGNVLEIESCFDLDEEDGGFFRIQLKR